MLSSVLGCALVIHIYNCESREELRKVKRSKMDVSKYKIAEMDKKPKCNKMYTE